MSGKIIKFRGGKRINVEIDEKRLPLPSTDPNVVRLMYLGQSDGGWGSVFDYEFTRLYDHHPHLVEDLFASNMSIKESWATALTVWKLVKDLHYDGIIIPSTMPKTMFFILGASHFKDRHVAAFTPMSQAGGAQYLIRIL